MLFKRLAYSLLLLICVAGGLAYAQNVPRNEAFNLDNYAGNVVYIDFWASWCAPCLASFPFMEDLSREFGDELNIVAINVDENRADAAAFLDEFDVSFDIIYDPEGELAAGFGIPGMPTSYLFDRNGKLIMRHIGFRTSQIGDLRKAVEQAVDMTE